MKPEIPVCTWDDIYSELLKNPPENIGWGIYQKNSTLEVPYHTGAVIHVNSEPKYTIDFAPAGGLDKGLKSVFREVPGEAKLHRHLPGSNRKFLGEIQQHECTSSQFENVWAEIQEQIGACSKAEDYNLLDNNCRNQSQKCIEHAIENGKISPDNAKAKEALKYLENVQHNDAFGAMLLGFAAGYFGMTALITIGEKLIAYFRPKGKSTDEKNECESTPETEEKRWGLAILGAVGASIYLISRFVVASSMGFYISVAAGAITKVLFKYFGITVSVQHTLHVLKECLGSIWKSLSEALSQAFGWVASRCETFVLALSSLISTSLSLYTIRYSISNS